MTEQRGAAFVLALALGLSWGCSKPEQRPDPKPAVKTAPVKAACVPGEATVTDIPLAGKARTRGEEFSSLAWSGDWLILLSEEKPRYDRRVHALHRDTIEAFLSGKNTAPLRPQEVRVVEEMNPAHASFDGFEAIAFKGREAWLNMESRVPCGATHSFLMRGTLSEDAKTLTIHGKLSRKLPSQSKIPNFGDEALTLWGGHVWSFHESNGAAHEVSKCKGAPAHDALHNASPVARRFKEDLSPAGGVGMPRIDYRLTDATTTDEKGRFWVINYLYVKPNDAAYPRPKQDDALTKMWGKGATHAKFAHVERLVELQFRNGTVEHSGRAPIPLQLTGAPRKWEGLVRHRDGFLMITDQYPKTMLAFIKPPVKTCTPRAQGAK